MSSCLSTSIRIDNPWIYTVSGRRFHFLNPTAREISIEDIAWSLSRQSRFYGHTKGEPYNTAQHSVLVSRIVPPEFALSGLLHDSPEGLIGDVQKYLKMILPDYQRIESNIERVLFTKYGVPYPLPPEVVYADQVMGVTEMRDLQRCVHWRKQPYKPVSTRVVPWPWKRAHHEFLKRFKELGGHKR